MSKIDLALLVMWCLIFLRNGFAIIPAIALLLDVFFTNIFNSDFPRYCMTALIYLELAQLKMHINPRLRYAFLALASVYYVSAADEMLYNHIDMYQGAFYDVMPHLVMALNAYVASVLFMDGGRSIVGFFAGMRSVVISAVARL
jgi:hypothetical protein